MKWLITGGAGFLGKNLIARILETESDYSIRVLDNLSVGTRDDLNSVCQFDEPGSCDDWSEKSVSLFLGDIMDPERAMEVSKGADVIVHFAANTGVGPSVENPRMDCTTNVIGTFNMLESARHNEIKRFVFASSGAPIGECIPPIHEELAAHPVSPYGASKLAGEGYCSAYFRTFGVETVALRFGNVYGPGSTHKSSVVAKFIRLAFDGEKLEVFGDGTQTRDFIYVGDLLDAVLKAASVENIGGEIFQIATNKETTVNELVDTMLPILEEAGYKPNIFNSEKRLGDVMRNFSDTSKAEKMLGWKATTEIDAGIRKTVAFFEGLKADA